MEQTPLFSPVTGIQVVPEPSSPPDPSPIVFRRSRDSSISCLACGVLKSVLPMYLSVSTSGVVLTPTKPGPRLLCLYTLYLPTMSLLSYSRLVSRGTVLAPTH